MSATVQTTFLSTRRGKITLVLVCAAGFLDFVDTTIVNVALPSIRDHLHFSVQNLQWILSGYLLTYGGLLLLGGRAADLLGRRRMLVAGTALFGMSSLLAGLSESAGMLVGARLAQGIGAAMMTPAALSILTTSFSEGTDRRKAIGVWSGTVPLASALGVVLGGVLSQGPGWRWVFFVNVPLSALVLAGAFRFLPDDRRRPTRTDFDVIGAILSTTGALALVYALVNAPVVGWTRPRTFGEIAVALVLLVGFAANERRQKSPLVPFSIFRIKGVASADVTQVLAGAGFISMFFFITLYMQNVLGFSPIQAGLAYLPVTIAVGLAASVSTQLLARTGTRPVILAGTLIGAGGVYWLSRIPVHGSYLTNLLPGLVIMALGLGAVFVGVQTAANADVPPDKAGLAAGLINASNTLGSALGLAILTVVATSQSHHLRAAGASPSDALTAGFQRGLIGCSIFLLLAAAIAARASNTHVAHTGSGAQDPATKPEPEPVLETA